jgi:hypothetical protein
VECSKKNTPLQRKLMVGASNDPLEQEADRVSDRAMTTPSHSGVSGAVAHVRRFSAPSNGLMDAAPASVGQALSEPGRPLEPSVRGDMEKRFGHEFTRVRVHSGTSAEQSARDVSANAYTVGHDIVFGRGKYAPGTHEGRRLLAHELTHVVQQSAIASTEHHSNAAATVIRRDTAGGGSTEFEDKVTVLARPTSGPGPVHGTVTRIETAPASGSQPRQQIHRGEMNVNFDPADCSVTIPFGYNFVQAAQSGTAGFCDDPPPTTAVSPLPAAAFNRLKASVLADVNRGLNDWFDVRLSGAGCAHGCAERTLPIRVVAREDTAHPDTTITVVNRGGRANAATICAKSWNASIARHEGGHQTLGVGDEYAESDERLRATVPQWFRPERVRRDYSVMGPEEESRFAMFQERHFHGVKTFLEQAFPNCTATLQAHPRAVVPDFRVVAGGGYVSLGGTSGAYIGLGLRIGIPLDRLRRWEFVLGPQFNMLSGTGDLRYTTAFLLGARLGLEGSTGEAGHGFTAGAFGELGHGWFTSADYGPGGAGSRSAKSAYGELGLSAGYRTPLLEGTSARFDFRLEGAFGSALGAPGIIGPTTREIETDPARSRWFRFGVAIGGTF